MTALQGFQTTGGLLVDLDETGEYPVLTVSFPKGTKLSTDFVKACHFAAGELGANIVFAEKGAVQ
jgi:hypothetical protein